VFGVGNSLLLYPCVMSRVTKMIVVMDETLCCHQLLTKFKILCSMLDPCVGSPACIWTAVGPLQYASAVFRL